MEAKVLLKDVAIQFTYPRCLGSNGMVGCLNLGWLDNVGQKDYIVNDIIYIYICIVPA